MKTWQEISEGSWALVAPNKGKIQMAFANGWTASVIAQALGLNSCIVFPADDKIRNPKFNKLGPQEAFDDEVADWLGQVAAWEPPK